MNTLYLYVFLSIYLLTNISIFRSIRLSMYISSSRTAKGTVVVYLSMIYIYNYLSNYIYLVIYLCVHLFISMYILGVWAREYIPKGTRFGPMLGEIHPKHNDISGKRKNA